jgi:hypothetical protein
MLVPKIQHLFDSTGNWIAYKRGDYVFDPSGNWIGWLPWTDGEVVDTNGQYLGTIFGTNRLYHMRHRAYRALPGYPAYPGYGGYPGYPGFGGYSPLPLGASDLTLSKEAV